MFLLRHVGHINKQIKARKKGILFALIFFFVFFWTANLMNMNCLLFMIKSEYDFGEN